MNTPEKGGLIDTARGGFLALQNAGRILEGHTMAKQPYSKRRMGRTEAVIWEGQSEKTGRPYYKGAVSMPRYEAEDGQWKDAKIGKFTGGGCDGSSMAMGCL